VASNASDSDFIPAARPIVVIEISRSALSEQRYTSLDELKAGVEQEAPLSAQAVIPEFR
jgi:hypothetical protein